MVTLYEQDIRNIMEGAALMASGGGGSCIGGFEMLDAFKKAHPEKPVEVKMISPSEMENGVFTAVVAGMGAPTGGENKDFTPCALSAFDEIKRIAVEQGKKIAYTMPIEMGGFNTFVPMLISLNTGLPLVDADAAGRAVPGLETILSHINGCDTSPVAMADENDNRVEIRTKNPKDALLVQGIAGPIAQKFESNAGIAGWMLNKEEVLSKIPNGTITIAKKIGEVIEAARKAGGDALLEIFDKINDMGIVNAEAITGRAEHIYEFKTSMSGGFDVGSYYVGEKTSGFLRRYRIAFQNENLILYKVRQDKSEVPGMTAPDIITMYNAVTGEPVTNEDLDRHEKAGTLDSLLVIPGVIKVDEKWWLNQGESYKEWKEYFKVLDYTGQLLKYEDFSF